MRAPGTLAVLRIESHKRLPSALVAHHLGQSPGSRPASARGAPDPTDLDADDRARRRSWLDSLERRESVTVLEADVAGAQAAISATNPTGRGRRPHEAVEFLLGGLGRFTDPVPPSRETIDRWAEVGIQFVRDLVGPDSIVAVAAVHWDEASPHLHVIVIPISGGRRGWCRVRDEAVARWSDVPTGRLAPTAGQKTRPKNALSVTSKYGVFQDVYAERGAEFGLARGVRGSTAVHQPVDRRIAAELTEERARQAREREEMLGGAHRVVGEFEAASRAREAALATERRVFAENATRAREASSRDRQIAAQLAEKRARQAREREEMLGGAHRVVGHFEAASRTREATMAIVRRGLAETAAREREASSRDRVRQLASAFRVVAAYERDVADTARESREREEARATQVRAESGQVAVAAERQVRARLNVLHRRFVVAVATQMKRAVATLRMAMGDLRAVEQRTRAAEAAAEAAERRRRDAEAAARRVWQGGGYELWVHALGALQRALRMTGRRPVDPGTESELDRLLDSRDVADPAELVRRVEAVDRRYPDPRDGPAAGRER